MALLVSERRKGKHVLLAIDELEKAGHRPVSALIAYRAIGRSDGRAITHKLRRLEEAQLVRVKDKVWRTTVRGKELAQQLIEADARRGGHFRPYAEFTTLMERLAL